MIEDEICKGISARALEIAPQSSIAFLKDVDLSDLMFEIVGVVYLFTRPKKGSQTLPSFVEIACAIGHKVNKFLKRRKDSASAVRAGAFILYEFEVKFIMVLVKEKGASGHGTYNMKVLDDAVLQDMWSRVPIKLHEKLPKFVPYEPWESGRHKNQTPLVKTGDSAIINSLSPATHPIVFKCVNKAQAEGWIVNKKVLEIAVWAINKKADVFDDAFENPDAQARATKVREAKAVIDIAKRMQSKPFYHFYTFDFRGRLYPTTAYLHEQGADLARGLLLKAKGKPLTKDGYFWLMVQIANTWGGEANRPDGFKTDKIPLIDRFNWAVLNEDKFLGYAMSPIEEDGWMKADAPWQFLAACMELLALRKHQIKKKNFEDFSMITHGEVYIDGFKGPSLNLVNSVDLLMGQYRAKLTSIRCL